MAKVQELRALVEQRLAAAAAEILGLFERTVAEYERELSRSEQENQRHRKLLDAVFRPQVLGPRADVRQLLVSEEEQQDWSSSLDQEDPDPPHIKEEQEELWSSQEGEQLQGLEEADFTKFTFTPVPVKSEDDDDDEEKPQSSQLHQSQAEENREAEPPASSSAEHMETGADGEDCGGPGPDRNSGPDPADKVSDCSDPDTDDSEFWKETRQRQSHLVSLTNDEITDRDVGCGSGENRFSCSDVNASGSLEPESDDSVDSDFWKESRKPQLGLNPLKNIDVSVSDMRYNSFRKPYSCSECGKRFLYICHMKSHMKWHTVQRPFFCSVCGQKCLYRSHLKIHMRTHTGEKPFSCPVCGKKYAHKASMQTHMSVHTVEKQYSCSVCDKSFAWFTELKYHQCVGESSHQSQHWGKTR